ncbi:MAG: hypothetical protein R2690_03995 [Acidimicrobiales bacterium]
MPPHRVRRRRDAVGVSGVRRRDHHSAATVPITNSAARTSVPKYRRSMVAPFDDSHQPAPIEAAMTAPRPTAIGRVAPLPSTSSPTSSGGNNR